MAAPIYTLANLQTDIRGYTEVGDTVLSDTVLERIIKNAEQTIFRAVDVDVERFYSTSNTIIGNRYVSIPDACRIIRYVQLKDSSNKQVYLDQRDTSFITEYYNIPSTGSTSLTDSTKSTTGTYISNKYPDLLLYACLVNTYAYLKGPQDMLQYYKAAFQEALESYSIEQIGQRRRSEYEDGVIRAQLISKSPSSN